MKLATLDPCISDSSHPPGCAALLREESDGIDGDGATKYMLYWVDAASGKWTCYNAESTGLIVPTSITPTAATATASTPMTTTDEICGFGPALMSSSTSAMDTGVGLKFLQLFVLPRSAHLPASSSPDTECVPDVLLVYSVAPAPFETEATLFCVRYNASIGLVWYFRMETPDDFQLVQLSKRRDTIVVVSLSAPGLSATTHRHHRRRHHHRRHRSHKSLAFADVHSVEIRTTEYTLDTGRRCTPSRVFMRIPHGGYVSAAGATASRLDFLSRWICSPIDWEHQQILVWNKGSVQGYEASARLYRWERLDLGGLTEEQAEHASNTVLGIHEDDDDDDDEDEDGKGSEEETGATVRSCLKYMKRTITRTYLVVLPLVLPSTTAGQLCLRLWSHPITKQLACEYYDTNTLCISHWSQSNTNTHGTSDPNHVHLFQVPFQDPNTILSSVVHVFDFQHNQLWYEDLDGDLYCCPVPWCVERECMCFHPSPQP